MHKFLGCLRLPSISPLELKTFRDAVGVQDDAVARLKLQFQARRSIDGVRQHPEDCASAIQAAKGLCPRHTNIAGGCPAPAKNHSV